MAGMAAVIRARLNEMRALRQKLAEATDSAEGESTKP